MLKYIDTYDSTSGNFNKTEKSLSKTDRTTVSTIGGSFPCIFDKFTSLLFSFITEFRFFSRAVENPAAHTCQGYDMLSSKIFAAYQNESANNILEQYTNQVIWSWKSE